MEKLISKLQARFPELRFTPGKQFYWSAESGEIFYKTGANDKPAVWALLHETGHALLSHKTYGADFELLRLEVGAWQKARQLASELAISIDNDHVEDCLDTYRDWLHRRSICPSCGTRSLQQGDFVHYRCFNCHTQWKVTANRFCRAYRSIKNVSPAPVN